MYLSLSQYIFFPSVHPHNLSIKSFIYPHININLIYLLKWESSTVERKNLDLFLLFYCIPTSRSHDNFFFSCFAFKLFILYTVYKAAMESEREGRLHEHKSRSFCDMKKKVERIPEVIYFLFNRGKRQKKLALTWKRGSNSQSVIYDNIYRKRNKRE